MEKHLEKGNQLIWSKKDTFRFKKYSIGSVQEAYGGYLFRADDRGANFLEIDFDPQLPEDSNAFMHMLEMTMLLAQKLSVQKSTDIAVNFNPTLEEDLHKFGVQFGQYGFEYRAETNTWSKVVTCEVVVQE